MFATLGMMLMGGGEDLMVIFHGLVLLSVAVYVVAGINRESASGAEAAFKYFLLGAFASGFLLYGIALGYGATATTGLRAIGAPIGAWDGGRGGEGPQAGLQLSAALTITSTRIYF